LIVIKNFYIIKLIKENIKENVKYKLSDK